jgi:VanZ family protein
VKNAYAWLTLAGVAFVVCGSLVPFRFEPVPYAEVFGRFTRDLWLNIPINSRSDVLANVLLMIPVAFCAAGAVWTKPTAGRSIATVLGVSIAGAAISMSMEFLQTFLPDRVVSLRDVMAETFGSSIGALAFWRIGPALTDWLRRWAAGRHRLSMAERWLLGYVALLVMWQLMPLDLSLEPSMIFHKYREGRLVTVLVAPLSWVTARAVLLYVPVGLAASLFWRPQGCRRAAPVATALGVMAVGAIELSHLFLESRSIDLGMVLAGTIGVAVGVVGVSRLSANVPAAPVPKAFAPALASAGWAAVIVWSQWYPFNFIPDGSEALTRIQGLTSWSSWAVGVSGIEAVSRAFIMTLPLGFGLRYVLGPGARVGAAVACVVTAGLWCGVECGLALLPAGAPALAQVPVATSGAAIGLWLGGVVLREA